MASEFGMSDDDDGSPAGDDEKVGYKSPPKAHRFKKGQSGNPRGRRKGSKSFETLVREELGKVIQIKADGKLKRTSVGQALLMRTLREGVGGSRRAADQGLRLMERYGLVAEPPAEEFNLKNLTDAELHEWGRLMAKSLGREEEWHEEEATRRAAAKAERIRIFGRDIWEDNPADE
jgi:hypothetical protein